MIAVTKKHLRVLSQELITTRVIRQSSTLVKLKKIQADFQREDGKPVWLKGGFRDRVLYGITLFACYTGVLMVIGVIYDNAKPASWKTNTTC